MACIRPCFSSSFFRATISGKFLPGRIQVRDGGGGASGAEKEEGRGGGDGGED